MTRGKSLMVLLFTSVLHIVPEVATIHKTAATTKKFHFIMILYYPKPAEAFGVTTLVYPL